MVIGEHHERALIEALRKLSEAKSLIDQIGREIGEDGGKRVAPLIKALTGMAKRISSARKEGEKLIRRRAEFRLDDEVVRPPQPKWEGGHPPFQINLSEVAENGRFAEQPEGPRSRRRPRSRWSDPDHDRNHPGGVRRHRGDRATRTSDSRTRPTSMGNA